LSEAPFVTILIPALNEEAHIESCLRSLKRQTYPAERFEIVVVDNGSTDTTRELVKRSNARLLQESRKSAYWARNLGIENTRGDFLAFTDADCRADPAWISNLVQCAQRQNAAVVGGLIEYVMISDTLGNRLLIETHRPEHVRRNIERFHSVAGGNMLVRRSAFEQLGLFNVIAWGSDIDFSQRAAMAGLNVAFCHDAIVQHQCDLSSVAYWRRSFETRFGQVLLFDERRGIVEAVKNLKRLPWKPGLRSGRGRYQSEQISAAPWITDWLYRWGNRWMEFFGEQTALLKK